MRTILLSTAAAVALTLGAAPVLAQAQAPGSSGTAPGQIKPPATSSEMPGKSESAPGHNRPSASSEAPGKSEAAPGRSQSSTASSKSEPEQMKKVTGQGSSSQDASGTSSASSSDQEKRPAAAGAANTSQDAAQSSDGQKRPQKEISKSAAGSQDDKKTTSGAASQATTESQKSSATGATQQQGTQSGSASTTRQSGAGTQQNATTQQGGTSSGTSATATSSNTTTKAIANLGTEKRSEVTQAFSRTDVNTVTNVSFNVSVGATVTDEVRLAPLPAEVVSLVPQYRGYDYVVVRDEIVIVEPKTKKIVEVIHKSGSSRKSASVSLSTEQRQKFKTSVETTGSTRSTSTQIELQEGEALPDDISLMDVPDTVITEVPELRTYRYVVVGDELAIVEPDTRRVIEIIK